ncbi:hypothetical protein [Ornithinimicrobium kibberense]|uniref:hypothetical protein n=1 Tax=Ornithinimicrobium kibberense TaxID=282060 RepID=UPI0036069C66
MLGHLGGPLLPLEQLQLGAEVLEEVVPPHDGIVPAAPDGRPRPVHSPRRPPLPHDSDCPIVLHHDTNGHKRTHSGGTDGDTGTGRCPGIRGHGGVGRADGLARAEHPRAVAGTRAGAARRGRRLPQHRRRGRGRHLADGGRGRGHASAAGTPGKGPHRRRGPSARLRGGTLRHGRGGRPGDRRPAGRGRPRCGTDGSPRGRRSY